MNRRAVNNEYLSLYATCKDLNCLPYEGGLLDQPANIAEAFFVIRSVIGQYEAEQEAPKGVNPGG